MHHIYILNRVVTNYAKVHNLVKPSKTQTTNSVEQKPPIQQDWPWMVAVALSSLSKSALIRKKEKQQILEYMERKRKKLNNF